MNIKKGLTISLAGLGGLVLAGVGALSVRYLLGRRMADQVWAAGRYPKLTDLGTVKQLSILPLIDWYTADNGPALTSEPGVSYLIRADDTTILFDVGYNKLQEHPSPLLHNMAALGIDLAQVDVLVISHAHADHLGGGSHAQQHTFAPSGQPVDLNQMPAYVPEPLMNPTAKTIVVDGPRPIAPGVASMGPIPRQLFFDGWRPEQSLAINVEGKGLVLVIGCGHPTIQRIVARAEMLFDPPIYGIVGGLHYPVTESRSKTYGIPRQAIFGTGKWPWDPINRRDVQEAIAFLQSRQPKLVSLSPHDSCDWTVGTFRQAFGEAYQDLLVGREIVIQ